MIQKKQLAVAIAASFATSGLAFAQTTPPATPPTAQTQKVEKVEITGSNVKRVDTESVSPVLIITRQDIEKSGRATIADVMRELPINSGQSFNENWLSGFGTGGAGVSLRGLGQLGTLTLINGRRVASYAFAQNITDSFVDLNQIPSSAVERIEILKDGASAIYGSDAIAGVVNIIMRRDFVGAEFNVRGSGQFAGGLSDVSASVTAGFGDLGKDRYNVFGIVDYYNRSGSLRTDYDLTRTNDFTRFFAGDDRRGSTGGTWRAATGPASQRNIRVPVADCPTELIQASRLSPSLSGQSCAGDVGAGVTSLIPDQERMSGQLRGSADFAVNLQGYAEISASRVITKSLNDYNYLTAGATRFKPTLVNGETFLIPQSVRYLIAPTTPGNPFNGTTVVNGTTLTAQFAEFLVPTYELGVQNSRTVGDSSSALAGLKGTHFGWDWDSAVSFGRSQGTSRVNNLISYSGLLRTASLAPSAATVFVNGVSVGNGSYNPTTTNPAAVIDAMRTSIERKSTSSVQGVDFKATRELMQLPAGALGAAFGLDFRREKLDDVPEANILSGDVLNRGATATTGSRTIAAAYGELTANVTRQIEIQAALRGDRYSDAGSAVSPKVGIKFKPSSDFLVRANWGKGFRAPSLPQISRSDSTAFTNLFDYTGCLGSNYAPSCQGLNTGTGTSTGLVLRSNPNLKPERSESLTAGFVWSPSADTSFSMDAYKIKWKDIIGNSDLDGALLLEYYRDVERLSGVTVPSAVQIFRDPANGGLIGIVSQYINVAKVSTTGFDVDLRHRITTAYGKFTLGLDATYVDTLQNTEPSIDDSSGTPQTVISTSNSAGRNTGTLTALPRIRGTSRVDWEYKDWTVGLRMNYVHSYTQGALTSAGRPIVNFRGEARPPQIPAYTTYDMTFNYRFNKDLRVFGGVRNIFDKYPPYDPRMTSLAFAADQYAPVSRSYSLGLNYQFK